MLVKVAGYKGLAIDRLNSRSGRAQLLHEDANPIMWMKVGFAMLLRQDAFRFCFCCFVFL
jgi:hypothetical protein